MEEIERTELQRKQDEWFKERQEFRKQIDQLKSDMRERDSEISRLKSRDQSNESEINVLVAERNMLQVNQSNFDNERVFFLSEIDKYRHECDEMRGFVRGLELALSTLGRPVANPMID